MIKLENTTRGLNEQESISVLNYLLVGFEFMQCLDAVENLSIYRHGLKQKVKMVQGELEKTLVNFEDICGIDDTVLFNLMEHKKQLIGKIALMKPELKSGLNEVLNEFFKAPELTIHRLGIKIIDKN